MNSYFDFFGVPSFKSGGKTKKKEESTLSLGYATDAYLDEKGNYTLSGGDFNLPEFGVTPKGTFDPNAWSSEWSENDPEYKLRQQKEIEKSQKFAATVTNETNKIGKQIMETAFGAAEYAPVVGDIIDAAHMGNSALQGKYSQAALSAGLLLVPNVVEKPLKGLKKIVKAMPSVKDLVFTTILNKNIAKNPKGKIIVSDDYFRDPESYYRFTKEDEVLDLARQGHTRILNTESDKGVKAFSKNVPTARPRILNVGEYVLEGKGAGKKFRVGQSGKYSEPVPFEDIEVLRPQQNINIAISKTDAPIQASDLAKFRKIGEGKYERLGPFLKRVVIPYPFE